MHAAWRTAALHTTANLTVLQLPDVRSLPARQAPRLLLHKARMLHWTRARELLL